MATYYYSVIVQETPPTSPQIGQIWIKESIKQAFMFMGQDGAGNDILSPIAGA